MNFDPELADPAPGTGEREIRLRACPYRDVAREHPDVVCAIHLGLLQGALTQLGDPPTTVRLVPFVKPHLCLAYLTPDHAGTDVPGPRRRPAPPRRERCRQPDRSSARPRRSSGSAWCWPEHEGRLPNGCVIFTGVLPAAGKVSTAAGSAVLTRCSQLVRATVERGPGHRSGVPDVPVSTSMADRITTASGRRWCRIRVRIRCPPGA